MLDHRLGGGDAAGEPTGATVVVIAHAALGADDRRAGIETPRRDPLTTHERVRAVHHVVEHRALEARAEHLRVRVRVDAPRRNDDS